MTCTGDAVLCRGVADAPGNVPAALAAGGRLCARLSARTHLEGGLRRCCGTFPGARSVKEMLKFHFTAQPTSESVGVSEHCPNLNDFPKAGYKSAGEPSS